MDLRELGAFFKEERERRGLSQNDVVDKIKVGRAVLQAIEEGDESGMPHPVYAKGFVKNYAKLLGLDPEETGDAFSRALGVIPDSRITPQHELNEPVSSIMGGASGGGSLRYVIGGLVLLAVVAGVLWSFSLPPFDFATSTVPAPTAEPTGPGDAVFPLKDASSPPDPSGKSADSASPSAVSGQAGSAGVLPVVEPAPPASVPPVQPVPTEPAKSAQPVPPAPDAAVQVKSALSPDAEEPADPSLLPDVVHGESGAHSVTIVATEDCWIDVAADGGLTRGVMLTRGKRFIGRFNESLLVRLGNAAGVNIQYDDKDYPLHANPGEVKTLKFVAKQSAASAAPPAQAAQTLPAAAPATSSAATATPAAPGVAAPEAAAPPAGMRQVEIVGTDSSWVIVIPDGGKPREVFVKKGQTIVEPYKDRIEIKLGNPSSVLFRHEGQEYPMSTQQGEKKSVRFPNP